MRNKISAACYLVMLLWLVVACESSSTEEATIIDPFSGSRESSEYVERPTKKVSKEGYQNGDIIFHSSLSDQSLAIQLVTQSPYSHVGILYEDQGEWYVYEAISTVQRTPIKRWIARGKDQHYVVKRLKNEALLTTERLKKMKAVGKQFQGKYYDLKFEWSDDKLYCSELVWKIYDQALGIELGKLQQLKDFNVSNALVQAKIKERYGKALPLEQWVISPARIFECEQLTTVLQSPQRS